MQRLIGSLAIMIALMADAPAQAQEQTQDQPPVAIGAGVVASDPTIHTRDFHGHTAWSMLWSRDPQGRELQVGFIEGLKLPYREQRIELLNFMHDKSSDDAPELRQHTAGRAESIWGQDVFWLIASERAVLQPDPDRPETIAEGRLHRGDARRICAVFTSYPPGRTATLVGAYCRDLPPDAAVSEATARQWLGALDLKVSP